MRSTPFSVLLFNVNEALAQFFLTLGFIANKADPSGSILSEAIDASNIAFRAPVNVDPLLARDAAKQLARDLSLTCRRLLPLIGLGDRIKLRDAFGQFERARFALVKEINLRLTD